MKLGGHETFHPRPGWLAKGLMLAARAEGAPFSSIETADDLGVGRNMAKSIGWWLSAADLVSREGKVGRLTPSAFGALVLEHDPYMSRLGTWWLVHAAILGQPKRTSLPWFFTSMPDRFDRATAATVLHRATEAENEKPATVKAVQREIGVIVNAYARPVPPRSDDPEDNTGSPLQRLGLLREHGGTGQIERTRPTPMPPEALAYVVTASANDAAGEETADDNEAGAVVDLSGEAVALSRAARAVGRTVEEVFEIAEASRAPSGRGAMQVRFLAGERSLTVRRRTLEAWATRFFERQNQGARTVPERAA